MGSGTDPSDLDAAVPSLSPALRRALEAVEGSLPEQVQGVGQGKTDDGRDCLRVMVAGLTPEVRARIPEEVEGVPVQVVESGEFQAGG